MSSENAPVEAATEEQEAVRPNGFAARMQRVVAGVKRGVQRLRARFARSAAGDAEEGDAEEGARSGRRRAKKADAEANGEAEAEAARAEKKPPTPVRMVFIGMLALVAGILLGMFASYDLFADRLDRQAEQIAAQRETLRELEKESERAKRSEAEYRENLAETQKALVEVQRSLARLSTFARNRVNETSLPEAALPARSGTSRGAADSKIAAAKPTRPQSGTCDIGANNAAEGLARCLSDFNR